MRDSNPAPDPLVGAIASQAVAYALGMTLRVLLSNDLNQLGDGLAAVLRADPLPPLVNEVILVQSQGMRRWLTHKLARTLGCAASLATPFPERFCAELGLLRSGEGARDDVWAAEALGLRLYDFLTTPPPGDQFAPVRAYLAAGDSRQRLAFCRRLGQCFERYQVTRDDWLQAWEGGDEAGPAPHAQWQASLWRSLVESLGPDHPGRRLRQVTAQLIADKELPGLPERVHAFACGSLPPSVIQLLSALARQREVLLWTPSPTPQWWADLRSDKELLRAQQRAPARASKAGDHLERGNPLLASLGRQGRQQLQLLSASDATGQTLRDFGHREPGMAHVLALLQHDVVQVIDRRPAGEAVPQPLRADDDSLTLHRCHHPARELEVVRDLMLAALAADATLRPADCLVLLTDPEAYGPLARSILSAPRQGRSLPVRVADGPSQNLDAAGEAVLAVLHVSVGRATVSDVLDLLERPVLRSAADLGDNDIPRLRRLLAEAGVCWGWTPEQRAQRHDIPEFTGHSWRDGLDRLLVGIATGNADALVGDVLPVAGDTAGDDRLLGSLAAWLQHVNALTDIMTGEHALGTWLTFVTPPLAELLGDTDALAAVLSRLNRLQSLAAEADSSSPLAAGAFLALCQDHLAGGASESAFLWGGITVAALKPMRCLPFRVIAVCGLDDRRFPHRDRPPMCDLAAEQPRLGDRSARDEDRQVFLETLLAARERLILTWTAWAASNGSEQPASACVDELLDWCTHALTCETGAVRDQLIIDHPLQPFSPRYASDPRLVGFGPLVAAPSGDAPAFITAPLTPTEIPSQLDWRDLAQAWADPCAYFLRERLGIQAYRDDDVLEDSEPMAPNALAQWRQREILVQRRLLGDPEPLRWLRATGELPHGAAGDSLGRQILAEADALVARIGDDTELPPLAVDVLVGDCRIGGFLDHRTESGLRQWIAGSAGPKHLVTTWIAHLVAHLVSPPLSSRLIDRETTFTFAVVPDAEARLRDLLAGWRTFLSTAVPMPPRAARALVDQERKLCRSTRAKKYPLVAARDEYHRGFARSAESDDWVLQRLWGYTDPISHPDFPRWSRRLWDHLFDCVEGPL